MKRAVVFFCWVILAMNAGSMTAAPSPAANEEPKLPPQHAKSPDKKFSVDMEEVHPADEDDVQRLLVIRQGKKEIAKKPTIGYLFGVFWDGAGKYVAINNRTATSGDYIWIFSLPDGKCVKEPDSDIEQLSFLSDYASKAIHKLQPDLDDNHIAHFRIAVRGWRGDKLLIEVAHNYQYSRGGEPVSDWYVYDATVKMTGTQFEWVSGSEARKIDHYRY